MLDRLKRVKPGMEKTSWNILIQFIKFGLVGVSNTLISYGIDIACYYVLLVNVAWVESVKIAITSVLAFVISVTNSYYWNNRYVFQSGKRKNFAEHMVSYLKTIVCYSITGLLLAPLLKVYVSSFGIPYWISSMGTLIITIPLNFVLNKFWAFSQKGNE